MHECNTQLSSETLTTSQARGTGCTAAPSPTSSPGDQPRVRGEHPLVAVTMAGRMEKCPRKRGALDLRAHARDGLRGEHVVNASPVKLQVGSPPSTRGAPPLRRRNTRCWRITPAHAGSTRRPPTRARCTADDPRVRGEHSLPLSGWSVLPGSPPRTRGARAIRELDLLLAGITPAYAGSAERRW